MQIPACIAPNGVHPAVTNAPPVSPPPSAVAAGEPEPVNAFPVLSDHCAAPTDETFDPKLVRVAGRAERNAQGLRFAWSGTTLSFHFQGTLFKIELEDSGRNRFAVTLDGARLPGKLSAEGGRHCYVLAQQLGAGEHRITVSRVTEASLGESAFWGASTGATGQILPPDPAPTRHLEVIGDSITAAYGVEGKDRNCHFSAETENHALSYAALLAEQLHAELSTVAWSGKGVFSNRGSTSDTVPMPVLWERTLPARDDSHWDFSSWRADAVVIDLGTNDFAAENPDKGPFGAAYWGFLSKVRAAYPHAAIFCALSPLLSDQWPPEAHARSTARTQIQAAVEFANQHGDTKVLYVEHQAASDAEGWGCDWHPSRATQARMAQELQPVLAKTLGW